MVVLHRNTGSSVLSILIVVVLLGQHCHAYILQDMERDLNCWTGSDGTRVCPPRFRVTGVSERTRHQVNVSRNGKYPERTRHQVNVSRNGKYPRDVNSRFNILDLLKELQNLRNSLQK